MFPSVDPCGGLSQSLRGRLITSSSEGTHYYSSITLLTANSGSAIQFRACITASRTVRYPRAADTEAPDPDRPNQRRRRLRTATAPLSLATAGTPTC